MARRTVEIPHTLVYVDLDSLMVEIKFKCVLVIKSHNQEYSIRRSTNTFFYVQDDGCNLGIFRVRYRSSQFNFLHLLKVSFDSSSSCDAMQGYRAIKAL